jgi:hypothetical protein
MAHIFVRTETPDVVRWDCNEHLFRIRATAQGVEIGFIDDTFLKEESAVEQLVFLLREATSAVPTLNNPYLEDRDDEDDSDEEDDEDDDYLHSDEDDDEECH